jgi:hypothetical protein
MEEQNNVVNDDLTNQQPSEGEQQEELTPEDKTQPAPEAPGSKTESELLLRSLQEERDKRRELEARAKELEEELENKSSDPADDVYSDEGKALKKELDLVKGELSSFRKERELERVYAQYPELKDKSQDFEEYLKSEHPRARVESVAKLFLSENGLLEPKRKGLETPTGGDRQPVKTGMSVEEVKHLRETNYRKYLELLKKDQIKFS